MKKAMEYAVIVAAGSGNRMKSRIPKQFLRLGPLPIVMHTVKAFYEYSKNIHIILVLPEKYFGSWERLRRRYKFSIPVRLAPGGRTRFQSVKNGLNLIEGEGIVAIHDGVRPLVDKDIIMRSFHVAAVKGSAVTAIALKDSIRKTGGDRSQPLDRSAFSMIQTPQTFRLSRLKKAYELPEDPAVTDDATVYEAAGYKVTLIKGSYSNIKITTAEDLVVARALLKMRIP